MICPLMSAGSIVMAQDAVPGLALAGPQPQARPTTVLAAVECVGSKCALWDPVDNNHTMGRCGLSERSRFMRDREEA